MHLNLKSGELYMNSLGIKHTRLNKVSKGRRPLNDLSLTVIAIDKECSLCSVVSQQFGQVLWVH